MAASRCRIAELGFSIATGMWTYKMLRPDKTDPNYFTTVCTTMLELAEGVGEEELRYRMTVGVGEEDAWGREQDRLRKAVVEGRRKRRREGEEGGGE
jgi:hypothetical protein